MIANWHDGRSLLRGLSAVSADPTSRSAMAGKRPPMATSLLLVSDDIASRQELRQHDTIRDPSSYARPKTLFPIWGTRCVPHLRNPICRSSNHRGHCRSRLRGVAAVLVRQRGIAQSRLLKASISARHIIRYPPSDYSIIGPQRRGRGKARTTIAPIADGGRALLFWFGLVE